MAVTVNFCRTHFTAYRGGKAKKIEFNDTTTAAVCGDLKMQFLKPILDISFKYRLKPLRTEIGTETENKIEKNQYR